MWTKQGILELLDRSDKAVERAILAIYRRQTTDEQNSATTKIRNGVGFSGAHATIGSYYARWLLSGNVLTGKHLVRARGIAKRYVGQLVEEANSRQAA